VKIEAHIYKGLIVMLFAAGMLLWWSSLQWRLSYCNSSA